MEERNGNKKSFSLGVFVGLFIAIAFIIGLLVGVVLGLAFNSEISSKTGLFDDEKVITEDTTEDTADKMSDVPTKKPLSVTVDEERNTLVVSDQTAGQSVTASLISLSQDGWVAVHELFPDGEPKRILGARHFDAGEHVGEKIPLLRNTEPEEEYAVILHADDGDDEFTFKREVPVRTAGGGRLEVRFLARPSY